MDSFHKPNMTWDDPIRQNMDRTIPSHPIESLYQTHAKEICRSYNLHIAPNYNCLVPSYRSQDAMWPKANKNTKCLFLYDGKRHFHTIMHATLWLMVNSRIPGDHIDKKIHDDRSDLHGCVHCLEQGGCRECPPGSTLALRRLVGCHLCGPWL